MNTLNITIPGKPVGKARSRKGKYGQLYNPQEDIMNRMTTILKRQLPKGFIVIPKTVPVKINFTFLFNPVKSEKKVVEYQEYVKKPDLDNLEKMYSDIMSKIVFYDDNQVYASSSEKRYTLTDARTEIEVIW